MPQSRLRYLWLHVAISFLVYAAQGWITSRSVAAESPDDAAGTFWDSPKLHQIKAEWDALGKTRSKSPEKFPGEDGKDKAANMQRFDDRLFRRRLSESDVRALAASVDALPTKVAEGDFRDELLGFLIKSFIDFSDREGLVRLLSLRCPNLIDWPVSIELFIATRARRFKAPMTILGDAFERCRVPETRRRLAGAIRRSFIRLGIRGENDADYVKNAMRWYGKEVGRLEVNRMYVVNELTSSFLYVYDTNPQLLDNPPPGFPRELLFHLAPEPSAKPAKGEKGPGDVRSQLEEHGAPRGDSRKADLAAIQGTWWVVENVVDGERLPSHQVRGSRIDLHQEAMTIVRADGEKFDFRVRFDLSQSPAAMDLSYMAKDALKKEETTALIYELQEGTSLAIFEQDGRTLRIAMSAEEAWRRPTRFVSEVGSGVTLLTFSRTRPLGAKSLGVGLLGLGAGIAASRYLSRNVLPAGRWSRYYWVLCGVAGAALSVSIFQLA